MRSNRTNPRSRATATLVITYLRAVLGWAQEVGTSRAQNIGMSASDLLRKVSDTEARSNGLADWSGYRGSLNEPPSEHDAFARDVLLQAQEAIDQLGEDASPDVVASGVAAASRLAKATQRGDSSGLRVHVMKMTLGIFADDVDGVEHNHSLAPPKFNPPRGWDCCLKLPGQRPTERRLHDARYGSDAPMTIGEVDVLRADYDAEQAEEARS